jgi:hypothetical protein
MQSLKVSKKTYYSNIMNDFEKLKQFVFNGLLLEENFVSLEKEGITVRTGNKLSPIIRVEESDFSPRIVYSAHKMSSIFIAFFCLENSVRELISERLLDRHGIDWWETCVPTRIKEAVIKLKTKEQVNRYHTQRSTENMGYTLFGNLAQIIINNWNDFSDLFPDQAWITSRFNDLELSRNVIMHTGILPDMEIDRIESITRDWRNQVG